MDWQLLFDSMTKASTEVDYDDAADATGYATLILTMANEAGLFADKTNSQSYEGIQVRKHAADWIYNIKSRIDRMPAGDALEILAPYDFMYGLAHNSPAPKAFTDEYVLKAFEARINGDTTVDEYYLYRIISSELAKKNKPFFDRPLKWHTMSIERWYKTFMYGRAIENLSDYDTIEIVSILMSEDLFVFISGNQNEFKKRLYGNHRHYFDEIASLSLPELNALTNFLSSSRQFLSPEQYQGYRKSLLIAKIAHPETNRWYRMSLRHDLSLLIYRHNHIPSYGKII